MSCYVKKVVETAIAEIGYKESGANITKYASYFDKNYPDYYNTKKQGAEWCDIFVDYCILVNSADMNEALYVTCQPSKSCGAGCSFSYDYYKSKGRVGKDPRIGAQIFFGSNKPTHTGIVVDVYGDSVVTVEGNSDNMVKRHNYKKSSSRIFGYGYPRYSEDTKPEPQPEPIPEPVTTSACYKVKTNSGVILKIRQNPTTQSKHIGSIGYGETLYVQEIVKGESISGNSDWAKTTYKGITGYASCKYLVKQTNAKTCTVSVDSYLNVRSGPGTGYSVVGKLHNGNTVSVYQTQGNWACIGNKQWVSMTYLK